MSHAKKLHPDRVQTRHGALELRPSILATWHERVEEIRTARVTRARGPCAANVDGLREAMARFEAGQFGFIFE